MSYKNFYKENKDSGNMGMIGLEMGNLFLRIEVWLWEGRLTDVLWQGF